MLWIPSWEPGADAEEGEVQHRYPPTKPAFSSIPALSYMGHGETGRHCDVLSDRIACSLGVVGGPETQYSPPGLRHPLFPHHLHFSSRLQASYRNPDMLMSQLPAPASRCSYEALIHKATASSH